MGYVLTPGEIDAALARSPHATGDRVRYHYESRVTAEVSERDGEVGYVYYNGFAGVLFDDGTYEVVRWHELISLNP